MRDLTGVHPSLTRVMLHNYKSIKACDLSLERVSIIVGANGSGKSNLLDAIALVRDALVNNLETAVRNRGGIDAVRRRSNGHPPNFGVRLELLMGDARASYSFMIAAGKNFTFSVAREECHVVESDNTKRYFKREGNRISSSENELQSARVASHALLLSLAQATEEFEPVARAISDIGIYSFDPSRVRDPQSPDTGEELSRDGSNLASVIRNLAGSAPEVLNRITNYLTAIVPGIHEVSHKAAGPRETIAISQTVSGAPRPWSFGPENVSDGTLRALSILVAAFQEGASAVAIEEPEIAIHPGAAARLMDALLEASARRQLILTTHSPNLLDHPDIDADWLFAVESYKGETRVGRVDQATREALKQRLFTLGDLLRLEQVRSDVFESGLQKVRLF